MSRRTTSRRSAATRDSKPVLYQLPWREGRNPFPPLNVLSADELEHNHSATLTIRPGADLALTKTASAATVDQAAAISYTVTATNNGPASASNVQIVDRLPAAVDTGATITSTPSSQGMTLEGNDSPERKT